MKLNIFSGKLFTIITIALIAIAVLVFLIIKNQFELQKSNEIQHKSYIIAEELRKTSDDLTRYCRTYVSTGDTIWKNKYWEIIDIRNGKKPRPDGATIALRDSMKKLGFTKHEFDKLKEAEDNSNNLVWTEKIAFNAMNGLYADSLKQFTILGKTDTTMARRIMFDKTYHYDKSIIMNPIDDFIIMLNKRTKESTEKFNNYSFYLMFIAMTIIALTVFFSFFSFFLIKKRIETQMKSLNEKTKAQNTLNQKLFANSLEIDQRNIEIEESEFKIKEQYAELQAAEEELRQTNEELLTLNENIEEQKDIIGNKNEQLEILLNNLPAHIYFKNTKLEYILINKSFENLFVDIENEIIGKRDSDFLSAEISEGFENIDKEIFKSKKSQYDIIKKYTNTDNTIHYTSTTKVLYTDSWGETKGIIGIVQDVTERILQEQKLERNKQIIEQAHKDITDSINYAKTIQDAMLTRKDLIDSYIKNYFIFYKPKGKLGGDFYYFKKIGKYLILAVADCTGHGVPGALITMLGITYLHEIVNKQAADNPGIALNMLRKRFKKTFKLFDSNNSNGLDIALCRINTETNILQYAGAYNPLILIRDNKLIEYKATKNPIGFYPKEKEFENNIIQLQKNDIIYLYSDGFHDQFGENDRKKFMSNKFKSLLFSNHKLPMKTQKNKLVTIFNEWKGANDQTDDVLVFGMKY